MTTMTYLVCIALICFSLSGCGQQVPPGPHLGQKIQDKQTHSPGSNEISFGDAEALAGEMLTDSIGMSLYNMDRVNIVSLERLVEHDKNGRAIMIITDTLRFAPPAVALSFKRCSRKDQVVWLAVGQNSAVIDRYGAWTADKDGLNRLGPSMRYDCPQDDGPTMDDN